ncbi:primosomal protein N' [Philodulcilactobacillus myokoensis]|uniref:Replication restart protein PriA n=1 Tax=Philodulcilactobacillus myokoensis TaxID=2929573 RepID=A0A9W6ET63_9LACO|nr:primosomal protein N' [Philodulcilactobacillus myokoensis]GLB46809.1 primosomal protein N' [Philodulcilactobacillus myokoensis]
MELAEILVDVPTMQTNQPYTYQIPTFMKEELQRGMRVVVPFGHRKVQGIVMNVVHHGTFNGRLKSIDSLMDLSPVINDEMYHLSFWLAQKTFSFQITCLLTMLPSVMKAKYQKLIKLLQPTHNQSINDIFHGQKVISFNSNSLSDEQIKLLLKLKRQKKIQVNYVVKNQAKSKKEIAVRSKLSKHQLKQALEQIPKNSVAQITVLKFFIQHYDISSVKQSFLTKLNHVSASTIKNMQDKGWLIRFKVEQYRNPYQRPIKRNYPLKLNYHQKVAVNAITRSVDQQNSNVFLLEGVTGSGKTEVYLQSIQKALIHNRTALMLVPEISLTPQMVNRVKGRFGNLVAILHSGLSRGEKYDEWRRINNGNAKVVVGVRSAIFAPLKNIGIIVMDEEHDDSYKQEDAPRYSTREVAKWRGKYNHCPVVLGSATPSLESRARAGKNVYHLLKLPERINHQALPQIKIVDMREQIANYGVKNFSKPLLASIKEKINRHEQVVLMLNRRGYSSFIMCRDCGFVLKCPNCDISLTLHMSSHTMRCHYCGHEEPIPTKCPNCGSKRIGHYGSGTEKVERELQQLIPEAKIIRMDVDTTRRKGSHERILNRFGQGKANILLGTQMIAKGLDFPNVTLVGVLNADTALQLPDFRSGEKTFQLLTQVSGRAGRAKKSGTVYIQTYNPDNYAIRLAETQNYERFYTKEMGIRHAAGYPPYYFTVRITVSDLKEVRSAGEANVVFHYLQNHLSDQTILLGPTQSTILKIKRRYYYQIIIKYKREKNLNSVLSHILMNTQKDFRRGLRVEIDPNPLKFI